MPEAIPVFDDSYAVTIRDDESDPGEQRFVTLGNPIVIGNPDDLRRLDPAAQIIAV
jgi:hypothetical protein